MSPFTMRNIVLGAVVLAAKHVLAHPLFTGRHVARAEHLLDAYDYVIVGAGASGLTVANRLSEQPSVTVLVIEAGKHDNNEDFITIPGLAGGAVGTQYDWNTSYTPAEGLDGRVVEIPQGKVVGGSTKLNRMVFDRGAKSDYDGWETLGNEGWNWNALLPYFKKNEKFIPPTEEIQAEYDIKWEPQYHGGDGYMNTTYSPFIWPTTKNLISATNELGIQIPDDQASGNAIGGYFCPHNMSPEEWIRCSSDEAYYDTAKGRENLHLITGQLATRIITEKTNDFVKATGIEYAASADSARQTVTANKEVLLAAGSLHTPQLMQVSGIGDPSLLSSINVSTVVDLPSVGANLHDHVSVAIVNTLTTNVTTNTLTTNETFAAEARAQYDESREGPLTSPTGDFLLFLPLSTYSNASAAIHEQATSADPSASLPSDAAEAVVKGYQAQYDSLNNKLLADDAAFLEVIWADGVMVLGLQHPYSRGSLKASSSSMFDAPLADAGILRNPLDVALLREGVHFARRLASTSAISELNPTEVSPGADVTNDADLDAFIRDSATTLYHPSGSCSMGLREEGGCVDAELRVYGLEGLRVVDASVIPILPASHTMTTNFAVAERAADFVKGEKVETELFEE